MNIVLTMGLLVATETAMAQVTPVCDRTWAVRDAIVDAVPGVSDCADVTEKHLSEIRGGLGLTGPNNLGYWGTNTGLPTPIQVLKAGDFSGLSSLKGLLLGYNAFASLPVDIFSGMPSLEILQLRNNLLTSLPAGLFSGLTSLRSLDLSANELTSVPEGHFSELSSLEILRLHDNYLTSLSAGSFSGLASLEVLQLSTRHMTSLPVDIFSELASLELLQLSAHDLTHLPAGIFSRLLSLQELELWLNFLTSVPEGIFSGLASLETLRLFVDKLPGLPADVFSGLTSLEVLQMYVEDLTVLPEGLFSEIPSLKELDLQSEYPTRLPHDFFSGLASLEALDLSVRRLTSLPADIFSELASLRSLGLHNNYRLASVPVDIFSGLTLLRSLDLSSNNLSSLPVGIFSGLTLLRSLELHTNELASLPVDIFSGLASLRSLDLNSNDLASLPVDIFSGLTSIHELDLSWNHQLTDMPADIFSGLTSLRSLDLRSSGLRSLPADIFSGLTSLRSLDLSSNFLRSLPADIFSGLISLGSISLGGNSLINLPDGLFSGLSSLEELHLYRGRPPYSRDIPVTLDRVTVGQFQARARTGAPFEIILPVNVANGVIDGETNAVTIPAGSVESAVFTVSRSPDTTAAVTVDIGTFPNLPPKHTGYRLVKFPMPVTVLGPLSLEFPHFANGASIISDLVLVNVGAAPSQIALYFYDKGGDLMAPASLVDIGEGLQVHADGALAVKTEVPALGEVVISTHGRGELVTGSVRAVADGPIGGALRFDSPNFGVAGLGSSPPARDAIFPVRRREGSNIGAAILNPGEDPITVTCQLMQDGHAIEETMIPLGANGQTARFIDEMFTETDTSDFFGSVHCTALDDGMFISVALEMDFQNRVFTTLPVAPVRQVRTQDSTQLYFPHFANGSSITSDLVFVNVGAGPIRPAIYFYTEEGNLMVPRSVVDVGDDNVWALFKGALIPQDEKGDWETVPPLGEFTISTHGRGNLVTGSVKVVADGPLDGFLRFDRLGLGVAGVGASGALQDAVFPARYRAGSIRTGVALRNLEPHPMTLTCQLMRKGAVLEEIEIPLTGNGQVAKFIDEIFETDTSDFVGVGRCSAPDEGRFTGVALEMDPGNRVFTTLPVIPVSR